MLHRPLLDLLDRYTERYDDQHDAAAKVAALANATPDCFERTCRPGHLTGSAWVLSADRQRCLLVHHRKLGRWLQPGGHADGQTDLLAVAIREAEEESGLTELSPLGDGPLPTPLDVDVHTIPARHDAEGRLVESSHEHHDIRFLLAAVKDEPLVVSSESHDVRWFEPSEVLQVTEEESVLRLLRKSQPWMA